MTLHRPLKFRLALAATLLVLSTPLVASTSPAQAASAAPPAPAPRQDAAVQGVILHLDGTPAEGVSVEVVGHDGAGFGGVLVAVFSLGLACIFDSSVCVGTSTGGGGSQTDDEGRYRGALPGSYVPGTETDTDWVVTASLPAAEGQVQGPSSSFEFEVNIALQSAPPLTLWEQTPSVSVDGWQATASAGEPPAGADSPTVWFGRRGGQPFPVSDPAAAFDLRNLESGIGDDGAIRAFATSTAHVRVAHANGRTIYHQNMSTATVALPAVNLVPTSRGARCSMVDAAGTPVPPVGGDGCPVTDGNRIGSVPEGTRSVTVELPTMTDVADVFLAGCRPGCTVELSADGSTWSLLANAPASTDRDAIAFRPPLVASPEAARAARFVRVTQPEGFGGLAEVSVWTGAPIPLPKAKRSASAAAGDPTGSPLASDRAEAKDSADGDAGIVMGMAAVAALALLGVGVAHGIAWARRPV